MARNINRAVCVVTGASSGVGRAIARAFAAEGCRVALLARNKEALEHCAQEVRGLGGEALVLPTDVAFAGAVDAAALAVMEEWGQLDVWVNDAMVTVFSPADRITPEEYRRVTEVNYLGTVYGTLAALRLMKPVGRGVVIQIGSALAYRSIPLQAAYCASKAAVRGFTDSLRTELLHEKSGVQLCQLELPAVNTPQFDVSRSRMPRKAQPMPPIFQPEMIARATVWLAKNPRRELWVAWPVVKALLGQKLSHALLDWYLSRNGFEAQMTDQPEEPARPDNLFEPLKDDRGAHGRFDALAWPTSAELWARLHAPAIAAGAALAGLVAGFAAWRRLRPTAR